MADVHASAQLVFRGRLVRFTGPRRILEALSGDVETLVSVAEELTAKNGRVPDVVRVSDG